MNGIIEETCKAIYNELCSQDLRTPKTEEEWNYVLDGFEKRWQFPNCIGALDGKHVTIVKPANSGSVYFNYKRTFSIILFALVDAQYRFLYIDVGAYGSEGDASIWQTTALQKAINTGRANLPSSLSLRKAPDMKLPPVIVGDDAFPLSVNLMKPYSGDQLASPELIFNYR